MKRLLVCLLFASPCLALPDAPVPKVVALPVEYTRVAGAPRPVARESWFQRPATLAGFHTGSVALDIITTKQFESRGYVEKGPYRFVTGPRPTVRCMAIGGAAEVGVSYLLARRFPKMRWLQVGFTAAHSAAGFHNLTLR